MDAKTARATLAEDKIKRQKEAEEVLQTAFEKIGGLGFNVTPAPVCIPTGSGVFALAAQIQLTPKA